MYYPRFTKVIIDYFMTRKPSIPRRNRINWHYVRDDVLFSTIKVVSRHQTTQQYSAILSIELTTDDIRNNLSYEEEPEAIIDRQDRIMRKKTIPCVKFFGGTIPSGKPLGKPRSLSGLLILISFHDMAHLLILDYSSIRAQDTVAGGLSNRRKRQTTTREQIVGGVFASRAATTSRDGGRKRETPYRVKKKKRREEKEGGYVSLGYPLTGRSG
nr:hypothetical protein [Tanacetum cinerariifolium]